MEGSSCVDGFGAGLILTNLEGAEFNYALRFRFDATNNEAEYEALIAGLRIAKQMGVKNLQTNMDSRLVANQVLVKDFKEKSINKAEVLVVVEEEGDTWMTTIYNYIMEETLPTEKEKARAVRRKSGRHTVINGYAYWDKIYGSKDHTDGILLANNACGCKKNDKGMSRLPGSPPCAKKPATKPDSHHVLMAVQVRFGIPREIISDNRKQFRNNPFKDWCEKLCIPQHFPSIKHPQANGLVERANKSLGEGIKARLNERSKDWIEEISHVLWAHRTMIKSSNGDTPLSLTFGTEAVIPAEIGTPTLRTAEIDIVQNDEALEINLDLLEERREQAAIRKVRSKAKMEKYYNSKVRNTSFKPGDLVYRNNDVSHAKDSGKLRPK
ncbi:reverse transcriptase domain-containing protein [Tanacetum coccineum]